MVSGVNGVSDVRRVSMRNNVIRFFFLLVQITASCHSHKSHMLLTLITPIAQMPLIPLTPLITLLFVARADHNLLGFVVLSVGLSCIT